MKPMQESQTIVTLDTAAGLVRAIATCSAGKVTKVSLDMPPAFIARLDATTNTPDWGEVNYGLCFGGVFYPLVDASALGLAIVPENARALATAGVALRSLIAAAEQAAHPLSPALNGLAYVMCRAHESDGAIRTCTTLRSGRADRSPCGTGSNASMAVAHAKGRARPGDRLVSRSIIGGEFITEFLAVNSVGPYQAVQNCISGQCWIYAMTTIGLDPGDPFPDGFRLSDTWGG
jgi:proline racemase